MTITIGNFKLISSDDKFNLVEMVEVETRDFTTKQKTGETRIEEKEIGYDMRLETCIERIINRKLNDQDINIDLPTYLNIYKKEREKVTNLLNVKIS